MSKFEQLQSIHQQLLSRLESAERPDDLLAQAEAYVEQVKSESEEVSDSHDREQLRANLRFWGRFIFDLTGFFPEVTLRPALEQPDESVEVKPTPVNWTRRILLGFGLLIILCAVVGSAGVFLLGLGNFPFLNPTPETIRTEIVITPTPVGTATSIPVRTAIPIPQRTATPTSGGTESGVGFLAAQAAIQHPQGCQGRDVEIFVNPSDLLEPGALDRAVIEIRRAGTGEVVAGGKSPGPGEPVLLDLSSSGTADDASFIVSIKHPTLTFSDVILQYSSDCSRNRALLDFVAEEITMHDLEGGSGNGLSLDWRLITWGPSPSEDTWVATVELNARGGDGEYIYWAAGEPITGGELFISGSPCESASTTVGVTSGGLVTSEELIILSPYCP